MDVRREHEETPIELEGQLTLIFEWQVMLSFQCGSFLTWECVWSAQGLERKQPLKRVNIYETYPITNVEVRVYCLKVFQVPALLCWTLFRHMLNVCAMIEFINFAGIELILFSLKQVTPGGLGRKEDGVEYWRHMLRAKLGPYQVLLYR